MLQLFNYINPYATGFTPEHLSSGADVGPVAASWFPSHSWFQNLAATGYTFQKRAPVVERTVTATVAALGGGAYRATGDAGIFPEETPTIYAGAFGFQNGHYETLWTFSARSAEAAPVEEAELTSHPVTGAGGGLAEVKTMTGYVAPAAPAHLTLAGTAGSAQLAEIGKYYGMGEALTLAELTRRAGGFFVDGAAELELPPFVGSFLAALQLFVNPTWHVAGLVEVLPMNLAINGAADTAKARLTVKEDFADLLATIAEGVAIPQRETSPVSWAIEAIEAAQALANVRVGSQGLAFSAQMAFDVLPVVIAAALIALGVGPEIVAEAQLSLQAMTGQGLAAFLDAIDGRLHDAREDEAG